MASVEDDDLDERDDDQSQQQAGGHQGDPAAVPQQPVHPEVVEVLLHGTSSLL